MDDLAADRSMRVVHILAELFIGKRSNIAIPNFAVYGEMIVVEITKGVCVHVAAFSYFAPIFFL
jgi:hypothetical protein